MVLNKWSDGDTITEREANNHSIRKGTEAEIAAIVLADREDGDHFYNSTSEFPQVQTDGTNDKRGNIAILIGADSSETSVTGTTPTQVKALDYIKDTDGFKGNLLRVIARIRTTNSGTTAHLRVRTDGGGSDDLDLTTTSTSYTIVKGTIDITAKADGYRTIEFFGDDGAGHTVYIEAIEVYGI